MLNKYVLTFGLAVSALPAFAQDGGIQLSYTPQNPNVVFSSEVSEYTQFTANEGDSLSDGFDAFLSVVTVSSGEKDKKNIVFGVRRESILDSDFHTSAGFMVIGADFDLENGSCVLFSSNTLNDQGGEVDLTLDFDKAILDVSPDVLGSILSNECMAFQWPKPGINV